jgi:hypothetical protein
MGRGVVDTFYKRASKHYHPAFQAAHVLDPLNFADFDKGYKEPNTLDLTDEQDNDVKVCVHNIYCVHVYALPKRSFAASDRSLLPST